MILPELTIFICGRKARKVKKFETKLTEMVRAISTSDSSKSDFPGTTAALLIRTVGWPWVALTVFARAATATGSEMSQTYV